MRGIARSETLLSPLARGRCVTGTSTTGKPSCRARVIISVFTKNPRDSGNSRASTSRRNTFSAQSTSRTRVPSIVRASRL